jgi:hypothetical protein
MKALTSLCELWLSKNLSYLNSKKDDLPIELQDRILSHLDLNPQNFKYFLSANRTQLSLPSIGWLTDSMVSAIATQCPNLQKLNLLGTNVTDHMISQVCFIVIT